MVHFLQKFLKTFLLLKEKSYGIVNYYDKINPENVLFNYK